MSANASIRRDIFTRQSVAAYRILDGKANPPVFLDGSRTSVSSLVERGHLLAIVLQPAYKLRVVALHPLKYAGFSYF